jgi:hypothetical protein
MPRHCRGFGRHGRRQPDTDALVLLDDLAEVIEQILAEVAAARAILLPDNER